MRLVCSFGLCKLDAFIVDFIGSICLRRLRFSLSSFLVLVDNVYPTGASGGRRGASMSYGLRLLVSGSGIWAIGAHMLPLAFSFWWRLLPVQLMFVSYRPVYA